MDKELLELIEKWFSPLEKMTEEQKTEVFCVIYKALALAMKRDFDPVVTLQIAVITTNKEEAKQNVNSDFEEEATAQPSPKLP